MKKRTMALLLIVVLIFIFCATWENGYQYIMKRIYPVRYADLVDKYAASSQLDPDLLYAVIKSESNFNAKAESNVGAMGLMQITPETFNWARSKTEGNESLTNEDLYEPEVNIKYGAVILRQLLDEFQREDTALAAYHAGRTNVKKWLANKAYSKDGVKLDYIPFSDTRQYVANVLKTHEIYKKLYSKQ